MRNKKPISAEDKLVLDRIRLMNRVDAGVEELNHGSRTLLASVLKEAHNKRNNRYIVDTNPEGKYEFFNVDYTKEDGLIIIKELEKNNQYLELMCVLKLKDGQCKGEYRCLELNPYYFETSEEREAEHQWEQEAERAMNNYYENRTQGYIYDDPRGQ